MPVPVASSLNQGSVAVCVLLASDWRQSVGKRIPSAHHAHRVSNYNLMLLHQCRICFTCLIIISVICSRDWKIFNGTASHHYHWCLWEKYSFIQTDTDFLISSLGTFSSSEGLNPCLPCGKCPLGVPMLASCSATQDTHCDCGNDFFFFSTHGLCAPCSKCNRGEGVIRECGPQGNTECQTCGQGTFSEERFSTKPCQTCTQCSDSEVEIRACMSNSDTLCMGEL